MNLTELRDQIDEIDSQINMGNIFLQMRKIEDYIARKSGRGGQFYEQKNYYPDSHCCDCYPYFPRLTRNMQGWFFRGRPVPTARRQCLLISANR